MTFLLWFSILLIAIKATWYIPTGRINDAPILPFGCPNIPGTPNFDADRYLGQWYQLSAVPTIFQDSSDGCVWANYTSLADGLIGVHNSGVDANGIRSGIKGAAALIANTN